MANDWYQPHIVLPNVTEIRSRIGLVLDSRHLQWLVEVHDPLNEVLTGSWSQHHLDAAEWQRAVDQVAVRHEDILKDLIPPF